MGQFGSGDRVSRPESECLDLLLGDSSNSSRALFRFSELITSFGFVADLLLCRVEDIGSETADDSGCGGDGG
jgi:hypothetical protein